MKKRLFFFLLTFSLLSGVYAQVDNYCVSLSPQGSIQFDNVAELNDLESYTIQFWFNPEIWTPDASIFSRGSGSSILAAKLGNNPGEIIFISGNKTIAISSPQIAKDKWSQITFVSSPAQQTILVNNTVVKELNSDFTIPATEDSFYLGNNFSGRIDEFRIWTTVVSPEFYLWRNTINKHHPNWDQLLVYYKFDQNLCEHVVDYKFNYHGVFSNTGAERNKVADNDLFKYRISSAYTDFSRFADRAIDKDKYLLTNDLIILGVESTSEGKINMPNPYNEGVVSNGEHLEEFQGRTGVLSLNGNEAQMSVGPNALLPKDTYAFHTWIYLEEWTEGAYIFQKEASASKGFSVRLGNEEDKEIILRINGDEFIRKIPVAAVANPVGAWWHLGVSTFSKSLGLSRMFLFAFNGKGYFPVTSGLPASTPESWLPADVEEVDAVVGKNLHGKLDETVIWHQALSEGVLKNYMDNGLPMPDFGKKAMEGITIQATNSFWNYDDADNVGYDSYSHTHYVALMRRAYEGHRGYKIRMSVKSHDNWQSTFGSAAKRKSLAEGIVAAAQFYDGIDLDFEWCYDGTCFNNYGMLIQEVADLMPEGKIFTVSPHYVSYAFPTKYMKGVDYFLFQMYGPSPNMFKWSTYIDGHNRFINQGYPKEKILLSYATTTSRAADDPEGNNVTAAAPIGVRNGLLDGDYTPDMDVVMDGNGKYRFITGYNQTIARTEYIHDHDLGGIFYWDMGNDVETSHPYSLVKASNYAISSNVDSVVTRVNLNPSGLIHPKSYTSKMHVYPNPAKDNISLLVADTETIEDVKIYDTTGKCVLHIDTLQQHSINVTALRNGYYLLRAVSDTGENYSCSFIKQ